MNKGFIYWFLSCMGMVALAGLVCILMFSSCGFSRKGAKVQSVSVHDKVMVHDSVSVHDTISQTETKYIHDTAVGIAGHDIEVNMVTMFLHDTVIKQGPMRLVIRGKNIDCTSDSLTIIIANQTKIIDSFRSMSTSTRSDSTMQRETTVVTLTSKMRWYQVWFGYMKNMLALIGALFIIVFIIRFIIKKSVL